MSLSPQDRPNSYIGRAIPRPNLARLTQGRGQFVSDLTAARAVHVAFLRSPYAHARILRIDTGAARRQPGVITVATAADLAPVCTPWVGTLAHLKGLKSAPQSALAAERACWQGEPVVAVVATTRALAEDALEHLVVDWEELAAIVDPHAALVPAARSSTPSSATTSPSSAGSTPARSRRVRRGRRRHRAALRLRAPHRRDPGSPLDAGRLEPAASSA